MSTFHGVALLLLLLLLLIFVLPSTATMDDTVSLSYSAFTNDASVYPAEASYDYIVVGGGTAGCPLAATLSESYTVLLLERGGAPEEFPAVMSQEGFLHTLTASDELDSPVQTFTSEDGIPNARGRVLGGGSAINAGFYSRAHPSFFDGDGAGTVTAWDMQLVNESYAWVEKEVAFRPHPETGGWQSAVRSGLLEAMVTPDNKFTVEHVSGTKIGASTFDEAGNRHTAADLLSLAVPNNIQVAIRATVERILFAPLPPSDHRRYKVAAIGVVYSDQEGRRHRATTRGGGEVILSAGALGSPQLLLLSGVGPWPYLMSWSIPVVLHSPDVGQYLYDNPRAAVSIFSPIPLSPSLIQVVGILSTGPDQGGDGASFIEAASSVIGVPTAHRFAFYYFRGLPAFNVSVGTILEKVPGPASVGSLRLAGLDVRRSPLVTFNYFANKTDLSLCVTGMRRVGDVLDSRPMRKFRWPGTGLGWRDRQEFRFVGPPLPEDRSDNAAMEEFCKRTLSTIWHYHGGCASGKVVDGDFRVNGVGSLRVVDGSVLRVSPGTNPQATLMMMGRYVGREMIEERKNSMRVRT